MIRRATSAEELSRLPEHGVEAQKIRALLLAYGTKYDFCRFFVSEDFILCEMNGSFVVSEIGEYPDVEELADFFGFGGFSEIFCSDVLGKRLAERLEGRECETVSLMKFCGSVSETETRGETNRPPRLDNVYVILKTAFDIDYEAWYTDMSHRIRHNVASARLLGRSALMIQYDQNGEALLSQIATAPEARGQGNASKLIREVCAELYPDDVYVICEDDLVGFYNKLGFKIVRHNSIIKNTSNP